jgi:cytochrome c biogenesis protein CcmG/thiol:disulfide interchange protein DsbE|tara:strand:- start:3 stop:521 length:519 start_codon:yes stop_codon:yes gene_type:complete
MKTKIFPIFLIVSFTIIFFVFYKGLQNSNIYTPEIKSEIKIPNFHTKEFFSKDKINSDQIFIGSEYYLLNIWASWCIPCKEEHKYLMNLSKKDNIKIIGQNYKDNFDNAKNFLTKLGNPYDLIYLDNDGIIAIEWGAYGVPETFLIKNNQIIKKIIGPLNEELLSKIKELTQ